MGGDNLSTKSFLQSLLIMVIIFMSIDLSFILANIFKLINPSSLHWLFSTSAQTIATLIAFLIAGYIFVYNILSKDTDETLIEINIELKKQYYFLLKILLYTTIVSIIGALVSIILLKNSFIYEFFFYIYSITFLLTILTLTLVVIFILYIIDPNKEQKIAKKIYKKTKFVKSAEKVDYKDFLYDAVNFESILKKILKKRKLYTLEEHVTIRAMIQTLRNNDLISIPEAEKLNLIRRYRNVAVHGGIERIDKGMIDFITDNIKKLKEKFDI